MIEEITKIRHSAAHIMAAAVQKLFPNTKFDIGPSTDDGFYYDFDLEHRLVPEDMKSIQKEMKNIVKKKFPFETFTLTRKDAEELLKSKEQTFKLQRLADIPEGEDISFYKCGDFVDLCRGPHLEHTGQARVFKLLSIAGSYFKGDEKNPMLQRIYGTAFSDKESMTEYLKRLEEAKKRDHRKLGKELDLFSTNPAVGPGLVLWHPKGARIRSTIEDFWRKEHFKNGYELLYSPHVGLAKLWETSGHLDFYKEGMYSAMEVDGNDYYIKPMNCPFHVMIYQSRNRSYRELPLRWAELGTVYRYEKSGVLHGLLRVRGFTQDDAHIICTQEQIEDEIREVIRFSMSMWKSFGFTDIKAYLATRPEKAVGELGRWEKATSSLKKAVELEGLECEVDEGGGAFYGPKIDLKIRDAIGREWQTTTIQFDFNLPERFDMNYIGKDGQQHRPYMVHRALLGSFERFFGILVEHYAGAFPVWLAAEQVRILPIADEHLDYAKKLEKTLKSNDIRCTLDTKDGNIGSKIRRARNERLPYMLILGNKEIETESVSVFKRGEGDIGSTSFDKFLSTLNEEIINKV